MDNREQGRSLLASSFWLASSGLANQAVSFATFVLIARLVAPAEFGLVALAAVLIELMQIISNAGIADAVIQRPALDERTADTAFWLNAGGGILAAALAILLAGHAASAFGVPGLTHVIRVLSLTFLVAPLGAIHAARLARVLGFRKLALRNLAANLLSGIVGAALALRGGGVDALIAQRLTAAAAIAVIGCLSYRWLPAARFDARACRGLAAFGLKTMGGQLLLTANVRAIELIAGLLMGPAAVATIRVANRCADMMIGLALMPFQQLALPFLSRLQHDPAALRRGYAGLSRFSALVVYPVFAGVFALAPVLVPAVFGPQWREAGSVLQVMCLVAVAVHINVLLPATLAAAGHPGQVLGWSAGQLALGVAAAALGVRYGMLGLVSANLVRAYLLLPLGLAMLRRKTGIGAGLVFGSIARPLGAALVMAAVMCLVQAALPNRSPWTVLGACVAAGAFAYALLILLLLRGVVAEGVQLLPARLTRRTEGAMRRLTRLAAHP